LLEGSIGESGRRRDDAIQAYLRAQYEDDKEVKFKQVDLYNHLFDLFVDVPIRPSGAKATTGFHFSRAGYLVAEGSTYYIDDENIGAADFLLTSALDRGHTKIVLEGAPGQGKSTITQYICQTNRIRLLDRTYDLTQIPDAHRYTDIRLPFRIDLRDYASWISGNDPFASDPKAARPSDSNASLESFLAYQVSQLSGGHDFSVSDLSALSRKSHLLIVLDGFDEVANVETRELVVKEINRSAARLQSSGTLQIIVTSRPAAFANSPGFSEDEWSHFTLESLSNPNITEYADKWIRARSLSAKDAIDFRLVLTQKLDQPHMRDLARNPMQLAILLNLIQTRGLSLPDKRTSLYDSYMELFFNREAEKSQIVREHRDLLIDLHRYLAWIIHTESETKKGKGSIPEDRLKQLLKNYLSEEGHPTTLVDELFTGMVERVVALVSRVQGTFEFEVQPLREYFAARHLYETAPYSPPGSERKGTKPERFDALARNFYWLNVTRFYCGCFSRGELASLADGLDIINQSSELKSISNPKLLALMLLSDWVFAQQPLTVGRVVELITSRPGFRTVLAATELERSSGASLLTLERCGRSEIVDVCKSAYSEASHSDERIELAVILNRAIRYSDRVEFWRSLRSSASSVSNWLHRGSELSIYRSLPKDDCVSLHEEMGSDATKAFLFSGRLDLLQIDHNAFRDSMNIALNGAGRLFSVESMAPSEEAPAICHLFYALDPYVYADLFNKYPKNAALSDRETVRYGRSQPKFAAPATLKDIASESEIASLERFLATYQEVSEQPIDVWQRSIAPWSKLVDTGVREFGNAHAFNDIALISAGIQSRRESGKIGNGLFDAEVSICERVRYARLQSASPRWWERQLADADNRQNIDFALACLFGWATPRTILELDKTVSRLVDGLDGKAWRRLMDSIARLGRHNRPTIEQIGPLSELKHYSLKSFSLIARRAHKSDRELLFEKVFKKYRGKDVRVAAMAAELAVEISMQTPSTWKATLPLIKAAYQHDVFRGVPYFRWGHTSGSNLPPDIAREVLAKEDLYPLTMIRLADVSLTRLAGKRARQIGSIAVKEQWFEKVGPSGRAPATARGT
jgi:hypothetical protein